MKKLMLFFAFGVFAAGLTQAQTVVTTDHEYLGGFGIRGGASLYNFGGSDVSENDYTNRV